MGDPVSIALITSAIVGTGATVAGGVQAEKQRQAADNQAGRNADKNQQLEDEAKRKKLQDQADAASLAARAAARTARLQAAPNTRNGTILTSPLGVPGGPQPSKTILGG